MQRLLTLAAVVSMLSLVGCVPSINAWFTEADVVANDAVVGTWKQNNDEAIWTISRLPGEGKGRYSVVVEYSEEGEKRKAPLTGTIAEIGGVQYLDLAPANKGVEGMATFFRWHLVRAHTLQKVKVENGELSITMMDPKWIEKHLKQNPDALKHVTQDNRPILTGSTKELQAFLAKHKDAADFYGKPMVLKKP